MNALFNSALHCNRNSIAFIIASFLFISLFSSCTKDDIGEKDTETEIPTISSNAIISETNVISNYTGLSDQTTWELQQARAATARYLNLENAKRDGYIDISVVVPNMGYHYLNPALVQDGLFDPRKPEILVYNRDHNGKFYLVAVEYAVPINLPEPSGFTGSLDEWDGNTGFELWLLHAWVWSYNPSGVFNPTNSLVHLH